MLKVVNPQKDMAKFIAIAVRKAMDNFRREHLSDDQMLQLNPIIRNAVYTALYAVRHAELSASARDFVSLRTNQIPEYWEEPKLIEDFIGSDRKRMNAPKAVPGR